jgi:NAD(P)-dependent dehydrogenase (short-subunit alcohol dehydrogenase family)
VSNECAIVVGATGTIGGAIARRLAGRGMRVVVVGRDAQKLAALAEESDRFLPCRADIATDTAIATIADALPGPVRGAVLSVGLPVHGSAMTVAPDDLAAAANVKLGGLVRLVRALDTRFAADSRLIVLTGAAGVEPPSYEVAPGAINAALQNLCRQLADLLGPRGTTVHAICPGPVDTARLRAIATAVARERGIDVEEVLDDHRSQSSLRSLVSVDQVAWAATVLFDEEARGLHGSTLAVTAGRLRQIF